MRKYWLVLPLLALLVAAGPSKPPTPAAEEAGIGVFFSPDGGCLDATATVIRSARKTLDVQAYLLTTKDLLEPIKEAHDRGVKVRVIMDSSNAGDKYSGATYLDNAGVPVWTDAEHKEAHNKVIIADGATILTGSFNFTKAADTSNAENLLVITGKPKLAAAYTANFEKHLQHSKPYGGVGQTNDTGTKPRADAPAAGATVYATANGKKYHKEGCNALKGNPVQMTVDEAKAKGLEPCGICKP